MRYAVTYQVGGAEHVEELEAADAAAAAAAVHDTHGRSAELFELISVQLLDGVDAEAVPDQGEVAASPS